MVDSIRKLFVKKDFVVKCNIVYSLKYKFWLYLTENATTADAARDIRGRKFSDKYFNRTMANAELFIESG